MRHQKRCSGVGRGRLTEASGQGATPAGGSAVRGSGAARKRCNGSGSGSEALLRGLVGSEALLKGSGLVFYSVLRHFTVFTSTLFTGFTGFTVQVSVRFFSWNYTLQCPKCYLL